MLDMSVITVDICTLHPDNFYFPKFQFICYYHEDLPSSIRNIGKLIWDGFSCACTDLGSFFGSICGLHLKKLTLESRIQDAPKFDVYLQWHLLQLHPFIRSANMTCF